MPRKPKKEKIVAAETTVIERWPPEKEGWRLMYGSRVSIGQRTNGVWYLKLTKLMKRRGYYYYRPPEEVQTRPVRSTVLPIDSAEDLDIFGDSIMMLKEWMTNGKSLCKILQERQTNDQAPTP